MTRRLIPRSLLAAMAAAAVLLVAAIAAVLALAALLSAMADAEGARALNWTALGLGVVLAVDLFALVIVLAIHAADTPSDAEEP